MTAWPTRVCHTGNHDLGDDVTQANLIDMGHNIHSLSVLWVIVFQSDIDNDKMEILTVHQVNSFLIGGSRLLPQGRASQKLLK